VVTSGTIQVRTSPANADVFVDGERNGVTPRNLTGLAAGRHTIRVTRPGYRPQERAITVEAGQTVRVNFSLARPSPATTKAPAGPAARTPAAKTPAQSRTVVPAPVSGKGGAIEIDTRPPGARVRLDNRDVGVSPLVLGDVPEGDHTIRLELAGFRPWETKVTIKAGTRQRLAASLERSTTR